MSGMVHAVMKLVLSPGLSCGHLVAEKAGVLIVVAQIGNWCPVVPWTQDCSFSWSVILMHSNSPPAHLQE